MTQDEKHAVALMRYGAIAPLISGTKDVFQSLDDHYNGLISWTSVSESSVCRFVNQLMAENRMTNNKDMRRYERPTSMRSGAAIPALVLG